MDGNSKFDTDYEALKKEQGEAVGFATEMRQKEKAQQGLEAIEAERRKKLRAGKGGMKSLISRTFSGVTKDTLG